MRLYILFWFLFSLGFNFAEIGGYQDRDVASSVLRNSSKLLGSSHHAQNPENSPLKRKRQTEFETNIIPEDESANETAVTDFVIMDEAEEYELEHPHDRYESVEGKGHIKDIIIEDLNTQLPPIEEWGVDFDIEDDYFDEFANLSTGKEHHVENEAAPISISGQVIYFYEKNTLHIRISQSEKSCLTIDKWIR
jgi:hypothetical protein